MTVPVSVQQRIRVLDAHGVSWRSIAKEVGVARDTVAKYAGREDCSPIDEWRGRPLGQEYPYVFMDGVWHKRCWGGSVENVSVLVAIGVGMDGRREVLSVAEGMKEDSESWHEFIKGMLARGLKGVRLVTGDRCAGLVAAVNELLPGARYQRCMVHFERNILAKVNPKNRDWAADALKAVFSMESSVFSQVGVSCFVTDFFRVSA